MFGVSKDNWFLLLVLAGQTFGEGSLILLQVTLVETRFHFVSPLHFIILPKRAHMQAISDLQILGPLPPYFLSFEVRFGS